MAHDFGLTTVEENAPQGAAGLKARLPHERNYPFRFRWHPLRWQWVCNSDLPEGAWLPQLGQRQISVGVGGIDQQLGSSAALEWEEDKQWKSIDPSKVPPGTRNNQYLRSFPAKGGTYWCTAWETPRHVGDQVIASKLDRKGFYAFLQWLIDVGEVPPPNETNTAPRTEIQRKRLENMRKGLRRSPGLAEPIAEEVAILEDMQEAVGAKAEPKRRRKSTRKRAPKKAPVKRAPKKAAEPAPEPAP